MGTFQQNGGRNGAPPDDNRPTWRPQDQTNPSGFRGRNPEYRDTDHRASEHDEHWRDRDYHDEDCSPRDPRRWEGSRGSELGYHEDRDGARSTERHGRGQSGYGAGRYGDDRAHQLRNRNEMMPSGSTHDRAFESDERFIGPGWSRMGHQSSGQRLQRMPDETGFARGRGQDDWQAYGGSQPAARMQDDARGYRGPSPHVHAGTGPHRGKGPVGYQRSDERLRELVCEALCDDDQIDASQIHVAVKDGEVTLSGTVDDRRTRRQAEDCVFNVSGVRDVHIQLRIADDGQHRASSGGRSATSGSPQARDRSAAHPGGGSADDDNNRA